MTRPLSFDLVPRSGKRERRGSGHETILSCTMAVVSRTDYQQALATAYTVRKQSKTGRWENLETRLYFHI